MPEISVILPTYNGERYLKEAIQSVLNQTFTDFELLIRDDGSQDGTVSIIKGFDDTRIRLLQSRERLGLFGNLNALIEESRGNLVHIFCQDDVLEPQCLESEKRFFFSHPEIGMSYCKSQSVNSKGVLEPTLMRIDLPEVMEPELSLQHFFYHGCIPGNLSTVCIRRTSFEKAGLFDPNLKVSGDYELWSRLAAHYPLGVIHLQLVRLRNHEMRLSHQPESILRFIRENRLVRKKLIPLLPPSQKRDALRFEIRRHGVTEFHQGLRAVLKGRWSVAKEIFSAFGFTTIIKTLFYWAVTGNNRFYRPQANWVLPKNYQVG